MKILIVDDEPNLRAVLRMIVEYHGHEVFEAEDGQEGLAQALQNKPDAIISDTLMPKMDGFQFLRAIRRDETLGTVPFIIHTAIYTEDKEQELALSLGADALIVKPKTPDEFWNEFTAALEARVSKKKQAAQSPSVGKDEEDLRNYCHMVVSKLEEKVRENEKTIADHERTKIILQESEERYRLLFENNPHPMWVFDLETLAFLAVNEAAVSKYGYSREEFLAMTIKDIRPSEDIPALLDKISKVTEGIDEAGIWRHWKKDGTIIDVEITTHTLTFDSRHAKLVMASDITGRRLMEENIRNAANEWRKTFDAMSDAISLLDKDGKILRCNRAMANLVKKQYHEINGRHCREIVYGALGTVADCPCEIMKKTRKREALVAQLDDRWFDVTADPFFDAEGNLLGAVNIMEDITERRHAEEILKASEEKYRTLIESANDAIFILDLNGNFIDINTIAYERLGYTKEEMLSKHVSQLDPPEFAAMVHERVEQIKKYGKAVFESAHVRKDGSVMPVEINARIIDFEGKKALCSIIRDISERKKTEEAIQRYSKELTALNTSSNTLMLITNLGDIYREICKIIYSVFDLQMVWVGIVEEGSFEVQAVAHTGKEDGYLSAVRVTWDDSSAGMGPTGIAIKTRGPHSATINDPGFTVWKAEAQKRGYVAILAVPLIYARDKCIGALNFYSDKLEYFTPDRVKLCQIFANQAASAIENARLIEGLETSVQDRTAELLGTNIYLQTVNKELELRRVEAVAGSRSKSEFLSNMSHELRTPLSAVIGLSQVLLDQTFGPLNTKQSEYLEGVRQSGNHLLSLINEILDLSKIEAGKEQFEPAVFSMPDTLRNAFMLVKEKAMKNRIELSQDIGPEVGLFYADERRVKQILFNLLSNAVKFTEPGGKVGLKAHMDERALTLMVWDTGVGIPENKRHLIFQPFQQLDSSLSRKHEGTGLGLVLSKRLVEMHGGTIAFEPRQGGGTSFKVTLPVIDAKKGETPRESESAQAEQSPANNISSKPKKVMVVEDNRLNMLLASDFLKFKSFEVIEAVDGETALDKTAKEMPDLILLDIQMPGIDRFEVIRRLRENGSLKDIPVIAMTALAMKGDLERCMRAGFNDYISKPINLNELLNKVNQILKRGTKY